MGDYPFLCKRSLCNVRLSLQINSFFVSISFLAASNYCIISIFFDSFSNPPAVFKLALFSNLILSSSFFISYVCFSNASLISSFSFNYFSISSSFSPSCYSFLLKPPSLAFSCYTSLVYFNNFYCNSSNRFSHPIVISFSYFSNYSHYTTKSLSTLAFSWIILSASSFYSLSVLSLSFRSTWPTRFSKAYSISTRFTASSNSFRKSKSQTKSYFSPYPPLSLSFTSSLRWRIPASLLISSPLPLH